MRGTQEARLRIGAWCVEPTTGRMSRGDEVVRLEARTLRLLLCLADRAGQVVTADELLDKIWPDVTVSQDSVYQAVASLRRLLGDNSRQPDYIATVPRQGYRLVAQVAPWVHPPIADSSSAVTTGAGSRRTTMIVAAIVGFFAVALTVGFALRGTIGHSPASASVAAPARKSIAVLPFLDLTSESMSEEYVADGVTEELIDKLSRIPGLQVAAPTSSFHFKGKRATVSEIAKALNVAYVLDGSIRRSGAQLRLAMRLIRTDNGFVVWSQTYDRQTGDIVKVQDDIAGDVARALRARI